MRLYKIPRKLETSSSLRVFIKRRYFKLWNPRYGVNVTNFKRYLVDILDWNSSSVLGHYNLQVREESWRIHPTDINDLLWQEEEEGSNHATANYPCGSQSCCGLGYVQQQADRPGLWHPAHTVRQKLLEYCRHFYLFLLSPGHYNPYMFTTYAIYVYVYYYYIRISLHKYTDVYDVNNYNMQTINNRQ